MTHGGDKLKNYRLEKQWNQTQMSEYLTIGFRSYQEIEKTGIVKKADVVSRIFKKTGIDMQNISHETAEEGLGKAYRKRLQDKKNGEKDKTIQYYDVGANAGTPQNGDILPVNKNEGVLHISDLFKGSQYAIRISGNSMTPNYPSGAIIGIRQIEDKQITPGSVYVIEKEGDLWIKRLFYKEDKRETGIFQCISDNTMTHDSGPRKGKYFYPEFEIEIDKVRKLFKVTGIYKPNELTVIN